MKKNKEEVIREIILKIFNTLSDDEQKAVLKFNMLLASYIISAEAMIELIDII